MALTEVKEILQKIKPLIGARADRLWLYYLASDTKRKAEIETTLRLLQAKYLTSYQIDDERILLPPPSREVADGKYKIGNVLYNNKELYSFGLHEDDWIQHVSIFGRTGAGKTNTVFNLLFQLLDKKKPFLIFDWKRNYRDIVHHTNERILIYTLGRKVSPFAFNPLRFPPGTEATVWAKKIVEMISLAYFGGEGSSDLLLRAIDKVYEEFGVYDGTVRKWPTFLDLLPKLGDMKLKGRSAEWMSTVLRTLHSTCFGEMGDVINKQQQTPIQDLLKQNVILELDSLTHNDKVLIIGSLLLWIYHFRMQEQTREEFKHALIIEEAHHLLLKTNSEKEKITEIILREIRELGESIVLIDQMPSTLTPTAIANTGCSITMNLKQRSDVNTAGNYSLVDDSEKWVFGKLPVGMAIVKLQNRFFSPFLVSIPHVKIRKGLVADHNVKEIMLGYSASSTGTESVSSAVSETEVIPDKAKERVTDGGIELLKSILLDPLKGTIARYGELGWSMRKGNNVKSRLVEKGYIVPEEISTRRGRLVLYGLTGRARYLLRDEGYDCSRFPFRLVHAYGVSVAKGFCENEGWKVVLEYRVNGFADLIAEKDGKKICIEVETGKSNVISNIEKCLKSDCDVVLSLAMNELVRKKILTQVKAKGLDKEKKLHVGLLRDLE